MTDICQVCLSERIAEVYGHSKDSSSISYRGRTTDGYFQNIDNVCSGDDVDITVCLDCGQLQGKWPVEDPKIGQDCASCMEYVETAFDEMTCPECGEDLHSESTKQRSFGAHLEHEPMERGGWCDAKIGTTKCRLLIPFDFDDLPHRPIGHEMVVESINNDGTLTVTFAGQVLELTIGEHAELI